MANDWRIWDGSKWISPCECNIYLRTAAQNWYKVDPRNCPTRYWSGTSWCPIICKCVCDPPYILDEETGLCYLEGGCTSVLSIPSITSFQLGPNTYNNINSLPLLFTIPGINSFAPTAGSGSLGSGMMLRTTVDSSQQLISTEILSPGSGYVNNEVLKPTVGGFPADFSFIYKTEPIPCPTICFNKVNNNKFQGNRGVKLFPNITSLTKPVTGAAYCGNTDLNGINYSFKQGPSGPVVQMNIYPLCITGGITIPNGGTGANVGFTNYLNPSGADYVFYEGASGINGRAHKGAIWTDPAVSNTQCTFVHCLFVPGSVANTKVFFIAISVISAVDVYIDNVLSIRFTDQTNANSWYLNYVFPVTLTGGLHQIRVKATSTAFSSARFIFMDIYDMGILSWPTLLAPGGYLTDIDKFVGEVMVPGAISATVELPQDGQSAAYLIWSTEEFKYPPIGELLYCMIDPMPPSPYGQPLFGCADGTTAPIYCGEEIICDSYPCEGEPLTELTEINIFIDNSGSMSQTGPALYDFYENTWKPCLILNVYGSLALFNQRVRLYYMDGTNPYNTTTVPNIDERPVAGLATLRNFDRPVDLTVNRVFNLTFADESDVYGYGLQQQTNFDPSAPCNLQWITDVQSLRNAFLAAPTGLNPYEIKTINFTVHSDINNGVPYPTFDPAGNLYGGCVSYQSLMIALGINNGNYNQNAPSVNFPTYQALASNVSDYYMLQQGCSFVNIQSVLAGQASWYYDSLLRQAFSSLNVFVPYC
jgi:hypothetical protein